MQNKGDKSKGGTGGGVLGEEADKGDHGKAAILELLQLQFIQVALGQACT